MFQAERDRAERLEAELSAVTFTPEISRLAQQLWSRQDGSSVPAWQRLNNGAPPRRAGGRIVLGVGQDVPVRAWAASTAGTA